MLRKKKLKTPPNERIQTIDSYPDAVYENNQVLFLSQVVTEEKADEELNKN